MRLRSQLQLYFRPSKPEIEQDQELAEISRILEEVPEMRCVEQQVLKDLGVEESTKGRAGMTAEQVLRAGVLRYRLGMNYRALAHATWDSLSIREFLKLGYGKGFKKSTLQSNIKRVKDTTWEMLNECLKRYAEAEGIEDGNKIRTDTTTSKTNIHYPTDASLLSDCVRVLTRAMTYALELGGVPLEFVNHYQAAKTKVYKINNSKKSKKRHGAYLELIRLTRDTLSYSKKGLDFIGKYEWTGDFEQLLVINKAEADLAQYIPLTEQVIEQAYRRIVNGEDVPVQDKVVSIFEPHSDVIVKGGREVVFGHKISLTTGESSLILDVSVLEGNPADSTLVKATLENHKKFYGTAPEQAAYDGGFASKENTAYAKQIGVEELTFSKDLSLDIRSFISSAGTGTMLRNFRAGIEGCISFLKRIFGWDKIFDKGKESFAAAIHAAAVAYNLTLLARHKIHQTA